MTNANKMNLLIFTFIIWSISLFVNTTYNYISLIILGISLAYVLKDAKEIPGGRWEPIHLGRVFNKRSKKK